MIPNITRYINVIILLGVGYTEAKNEIFSQSCLAPFFWVACSISRHISKEKVSNLKNRGEQAVFARPHPFFTAVALFCVTIDLKYLETQFKKFN